MYGTAGQKKTFTPSMIKHAVSKGLAKSRRQSGCHARVKFSPCWRNVVWQNARQPLLPLTRY